MGQVVSQGELLARRGEWESTGKALVCAYGVFDLLHPGHTRLLEQARDFGEIVCVAVQSDALVRASAAGLHHGARGRDAEVTRPVTPAAERAEIVAALSAVDFAAVVEEPLEQFLQLVQPDVLICGDRPADGSSTSGTSHSELEFALAKIGCKLVRLPLEPGYSTTQLIERIAGGRG